MLKVKIYRLNNDGSQRTIAVCRMKGDVVVCEGEKKFAEYLKKEGIRDYSSSPPRKIFFSEGRLFLEQLKYNFKSGYLTASDLQEE